MLAPVTEAHYGEESLLALNLLSAERWPSFAHALEAASGRPVGYRPSGTLVVGLDASDLAALDDLHQFQRQLGLPAERLTAAACRTLEPALAPGICGGMFAPEDHQVDNRLLIAALEAACRATNVTILNEKVTEVLLTSETPSGRPQVDGVRLADGSAQAASVVVLAAGCHTNAITGINEGWLPAIRPVKGQILRLAATGTTPVLERTVRGLSHGTSCYLVPRSDGRVVVGATMEERGFDLTVQAGAVYELLRDAHNLVPAVSELVLEECRAGLRPGSPDNAPFIGPLDPHGPIGLALAGGHHRNGILLAPLTADGIVEWFHTGSVPAELASFAVNRVIS
jgi:glycine oxidase